MKRIWIALLIMTFPITVFAQALPGLHESESADFAYTGTGWIQVVDGDYSVMESSVIDDSVSLEFEGASLIIYRELLPVADTPAIVEICIDDSCANIANTANENQRRVPISFVANGASPHVLTISNTDGGVFRLDYVIVMPDDELQSIIVPSPSVHFLTLESGRVVAIDFSISGGDIITGVFLAFLSSLTMFKIVMDRWHHE